jgi:hypothetical protein
MLCKVEYPVPKSSVVFLFLMFTLVLPLSSYNQLVEITKISYDSVSWFIKIPISQQLDHS